MSPQSSSSTPLLRSCSRLGHFRITLDTVMEVRVRVILHRSRSSMSMPEFACNEDPSTVHKNPDNEANNIPQVPHCDLSPSGPFLRPIAILSGQPQLEQCQTPSIRFACCPSANSFSFASLSSSFALFAVITFTALLSDAEAPPEGADDIGGGAGGGSFSNGGGRVDTSAAVDVVGAATCARGLNTV